MAADVVIAPTQSGDAAELFANLRACDLAECQACGNTNVRQAIEDSVSRSWLCWTGRVNGELAAILGVSPLGLLGGMGCPWMLGTPVLDRNSRVLVRNTHQYIGRMLQVFPHLVNFVYAENTTSVRWLRRLGFTLHPAQPYGPLGASFHRFERHK